MCRVLNKRKSGIPAGAIYIGRGSKWGNPFRIGPDGDRATVISKYERWLRDQDHLRRTLDELRGHHLVCFARRWHATAICCCGLPTHPAKTESRGGAVRSAIGHGGAARSHAPRSARTLHRPLHRALRGRAWPGRV
jgi:Domain of unknown function (DUF4326)